ncbi:hypothetical protein I0C86_37560 [Plantactinospora sp. S1510]|uniref:Uncharacterized protein n=1 Tax=Plantactinospora alkalitolerans TaxID=2789879 RepID=A0ABS0H7Z4_9ACTN|nr:hypothetical protein [Plantactinospora alkalitolerans]MBF9134597.1 hypothetical protein [Plantactinospora alkalitolerans]
MIDLLASGLPLGASDLLADKKSPASGTFHAVGAAIFVAVAIFLIYVQLKRRR